jgi:glycosyltransferase involved in cell wall biosynthesis
VIRVLLLADVRPNLPYPPQWQLLAERLPADRYEVHVGLLCGSDSGPLAASSGDAIASVETFTLRGPWDLPGFWRLKVHASKLKPDVVHVWAGPSADTAVRAVGMAKSHKVIYSAGPHDGADSAVGWPYCRRVLTMRPEVNGEQPHSAQGVKQHVIRPGIEVPSGNPMDREALCRRLGISPDLHLFAAAGESYPYERLQDVVWAADLLKCVRRDYCVVIIAVGILASQLRRFSEQCLNTDVVQVVDPSVGLENLLVHSQALLCSSTRPSVELLLNSLAAGTPVIATHLASHLRVVDPGKTGFLVPVRDRAGMARLARRMLENPELRQSMGSAGRSFVQSHHSADRMAADYQDVYESLDQARAV